MARHVCVVLFFQGRSAHEGDDTSVLNRRDRRITLTIALYLIAVIPAAWFQNLGNVLAASGAVGGSCLAYIGPGAVYLGVHGARFLELSKAFFGRSATVEGTFDDEEVAPLYNADVSGDLPELEPEESCFVKQFKIFLWYILLMPLWTKIALYGKETLTHHVSDLVLNSPHPIRIGNVRFASRRVAGGATRVVMLPQHGSTQEEQKLAAPTNTMLIRADSLPKEYGTTRTIEGRVLALPIAPHQNAGLPHHAGTTKSYQSIDDKMGAMAKRKQQEEAFALEEDPQQDLPNRVDFLIAISYIIFGFVAMVAGLVSLFLENRDKA